MWEEIGVAAGANRCLKGISVMPPPLLLLLVAVMVVMVMVVMVEVMTRRYR